MRGKRMVTKTYNIMSEIIYRYNSTPGRKPIRYHGIGAMIY